MSLVATAKGGKDFALPPEGTHMARCVQVVDLGTQYSEFYKKSKPKVMLGWELPNELNDEDDNKPFLAWHRYTLSIHEKSALGQHLTAWRGRKFTDVELEAFHLKNILGKPCMITVQHDKNGDKTYANVVSVTAMPKGMTVPDQIHKTILFSIEDWDDAVFETFSENLQKTIKNSDEYFDRNPPTPKDPQSAAQAAAGIPEDQEIPF